MDWFLILFTMMDPHVEGRILETKMASEERCKTFIEEATPAYEATEGLTFTMRCEARRRPKKEEPK